MSEAPSSAVQLARELADVRAKLEEAEQTLDAIRNGEVDAVVVGSPNGQLVYTLENADRPYRVLIEQMQEGAVTLSEDGSVLYCNQRFATIVGSRRETLLGASVDRFFADAEAEAFLGMLAEHSRVSSTGEFSLHAVDGRLVPVNISVVDLTVDEGMTRVVCAVVTDLTPHRRRTEELAAANAQLATEIDERRRIEDSLRLALEAAGMGSWEVDIETGDVRHSLRHDQIYGHPTGVAEWRLDHALSYYLPADHAALRNVYREAIKTGIVDYEYRIHRAGDQAMRWVNVRGRTYYDGARAVRMAGVISDVTDQRAVEEQLRQAQKMEAVGQLTGGIAHDFNNLLLVIGGSLDMLGRRIPADPRTDRLLEAARSGVARGSKLNHQLLAFSRRQDLHAEVVDIDELVPTFEHLLDRAVGETIRIEVVRAPTAWLCRTDPHQLETAILNLAINARDAMPDGGTLTLSTENRAIDEQAALRFGTRAGDYVVVSVRDTGTGMAHDVVTRAFEPFFTTKEIGKGTGLGLSQVYGFAKQSDGFVTIDSEPGQGTAVLIHLPRTLQAAAGKAKRDAEATTESGRGVVLLVEDDADVRATASAMLSDLGYRVREADTGQGALALIDAGERVDLVFSDVIMPNGMSGADLARELATRPAAPRVLLTSGYTAQRVIPEDQARHLRLLRKPYTQADLSQAVQAAMRGLALQPVDAEGPR